MIAVCDNALIAFVGFVAKYLTTANVLLTYWGFEKEAE